MALTVTELAAELGIPPERLRGYLAAYAEQADRPAVEGDAVAPWAAAEARAHHADRDGGR